MHYFHIFKNIMSTLDYKPPVHSGIMLIHTLPGDLPELYMRVCIYPLDSPLFPILPHNAELVSDACF